MSYAFAMHPIFINRLSIFTCSLLTLMCSQQAYAEPPTLGLGLSKYAYREPSLGVAHDGWLGIAQGKWAPDNLRFKNWPLTLSGQATFGYADYTGSGTMANQPTSIYQLQLESPHTEWIKGYQISPGVGYRYLYNDARGTTSTNNAGYRRTSEYLFASLGAERPFGDNWRVTAQGYYLLSGRQTSNLFDVGGDYASQGPLQNTQRHGYGWKAGVCKTYQALDFCSNFEFWHIGASDTYSFVSNGSRYTVYEPTNNTKSFEFTVNYKLHE
jgi:hypothetical protein